MSSARGATSASVASRPRVAELADEIEVDIVFRPYQLDPTASPGKAGPVDRGLRQEVRRSRARARRSSITSPRLRPRAASSSGWTAPSAPTHCSPIGFCGLPQATGHQIAMKERLLQAYFIDGLDIGDPDVLADCAAEVGLDHDRVPSLPRQRRRTGGGAPRAADGGRAWRSRRCRRSSSTASGWCPGAQDPDTFVQVLRRVVAKRTADV